MIVDTSDSEGDDHVFVRRTGSNAGSKLFNLIYQRDDSEGDLFKIKNNNNNNNKQRASGQTKRPRRPCNNNSTKANNNNSSISSFQSSSSSINNHNHSESDTDMQHHDTDMDDSLQDLMKSLAESEDSGHIFLSARHLLSYDSTDDSDDDSDDDDNSMEV